MTRIGFENKGDWQSGRCKARLSGLARMGWREGEVQAATPPGFFVGSLWHRIQKKRDAAVVEASVRLMCPRTVARSRRRGSPMTGITEKSSRRINPACICPYLAGLAVLISR